MNKLVLQDLITATGDLATLPNTVVQLLDLLKDSTCSASKVVKVLERDPAMTANILKLSNSAFYGSRRKISCVRDALVMLGNRSVVTLAFATGMAPVMRRDLIGYGMTRDRFWEHSVKSATAAAIAAERMGMEELRCEAFTAGLVHDVGMLVVDAHLQNLNVTLDLDAPNFCAAEAERMAVGFDHNEAGAMLATHWGFPGSLIDPIAMHHEHEILGPHQDIVRCVVAGSVLAQVVNEEIDPQTDERVRSTLMSLRFDDALLAKLRVDLAHNLDETLSRATRPAFARI